MDAEVDGLGPFGAILDGAEAEDEVAAGEDAAMGNDVLDFGAEIDGDVLAHASDYFNAEDGGNGFVEFVEIGAGAFEILVEIHGGGEGGHGFEGGLGGCGFSSDLVSL